MELVGTDMWLQRARGSRLYDDLFDEVRPQAEHSRTLGSSSKGTEYEQLWLQMERRDNALREHQRKRHKLLWMGSCTHTDQVPEQRGREGRKGGRAPWAWTWAWRRAWGDGSGAAGG
jgi:hypothetical protein